MRRTKRSIARVAWTAFGVFMLGYLTGYHLGLQDAAMGAQPRRRT